MADFEIGAGKIIKHFEGLYSNDRDDPGGETYRGVARLKHPEWKGWQIIDGHKGDLNFPKSLESDMILKDLVSDFYRKEFWDSFKGDYLLQEIAEEMFDQAINFGQRIANKNFQRTLNLMNDRGRLWDNTVVDGVFGSETLRLYHQCIKKRSPALLFNILNFIQASRYIFLMESNEAREKYIGWFNRIQLIKQ